MQSINGHTLTRSGGWGEALVDPAPNGQMYLCVYMQHYIWDSLDILLCHIWETITKQHCSCKAHRYIRSQTVATFRSPDKPKTGGGGDLCNIKPLNSNTRINRLPVPQALEIAAVKLGLQCDAR